MFKYCELIFLLLSFSLVWQLQACGTIRWYSIEQDPATPFAYLQDGVFVSGDYVRRASVTEIDGKTIGNPARNKLEISIGMHQVRIYCDEARGSFDSDKLLGQAKVLEFEAQIQRTYKAYCKPFTHWWIEDLENGKIVAGQQPAN